MRLNSALPILASFAVFSTTLADAEFQSYCTNFYGSPRLNACASALWLERGNRPQYMAAPSMINFHPPGVSNEAWANRVTLPHVRYYDDCAIAFLAIAKGDPFTGYTWVAGSTTPMILHEVNDDGLLTRCVLKNKMGGFRETPDLPGMVLVVFGKASAYENFLFSGRGASHYDAARQLPGGPLIPAWIGDIGQSTTNLTDALSLPATDNATSPGESATPGQQVATS
ncbi:MAG: hypothetical protein Q9220_005543 [cf. Caloplaca sp. 1 TL-2023]